MIRELFTEGAQILLLGAMVIGMITGVTGKTIMDPFTGITFKDILAFFLLDMGVATAKRLADLRGVPKRLALYGVFAPLTHVSIALTLEWVGGLAVANPSLCLRLSLGLTFPFNIVVGIPLYHWVANWLIGA